MAIVAAVLLASLAWAGPAWAIVPVPTDITSTPEVPEVTETSSLPDATGTSTSSSSATTSATGSNATVCNQLASQLTGILSQISSLSTQANATPLGPVLTTLLGQIEDLQAQADAVSQQLATLFCSFIPSDQTGDISVSTPAEPSSSSGSGQRNYEPCYCATETPVLATQVATVPSGGVDTGDGSF